MQIMSGQESVPPENLQMRDTALPYPLFLNLQMSAAYWIRVLPIQPAPVRITLVLPPQICRGHRTAFLPPLPATQSH